MKKKIENIKEEVLEDVIDNLFGKKKIEHLSREYVKECLIEDGVLYWTIDLTISKLQKEHEKGDRLHFRKLIQSAGKELFHSIEDKDLKYLVGDLMSKNEDWVLNHQHTYGAERILEEGFTETQEEWIKNLKKKLEKDEK